MRSVRNEARRASRTRIVNFLGMELEFDPFVDADLRHPFDVSGPRAKGQPVQRVDGPFLLVHAA